MWATRLDEVLVTEQQFWATFQEIEKTFIKKSLLQQYKMWATKLVKVSLNEQQACDLSYNFFSE